MEYDAVIVGAGPNGLTAAVELARHGLRVHVIEGADTIGGGARTKELTLPGFRHDVCSAIHPLGRLSPSFRRYPLTDHGLEWISPEAAAAHPFDDGSAVMLLPSVAETAAGLGEDGVAYRRVMEPGVSRLDRINEQFLGPMLRWPGDPRPLARFAAMSLLPATWFVRRFETTEARGLLGGLAAHTTVDLAGPGTTGVALALGLAGHADNWPVARGGSQAIVDALAGYLLSLGGSIETGHWVASLSDLPSAAATLLDVTPRALLALAGRPIGGLYGWRARRWRRGPGVFKIDLALSESIPWKCSRVASAATVHLGGTFEEIAASERAMWRGDHSDRPYVLLAQQSLFDETRAPGGSHTAWAYCHVPNGSTLDRVEAIESQIERFAPGFRDTILARHTMGPADFEAYNPNNEGGEIIGGAWTLDQVIARPMPGPDPYKTPLDGVYLCSASTAPGAGVHGMSGYHAARSALRRSFGMDPT